MERMRTALAVTPAKSERRVFLRFCFLQAAYWSFYAALPSYITAYMLMKGMNAATLGILLSVQMGCAFAGSVFWSRYVDRKQANRRFFLIGISSVALLSVLLFLFADRIAVLFVLYPLFGFMNGPIATTLDSWVIAVTHRVEDGAKSRTFGTLGYAVTMLISGIVINRFGYRLMPYIAVGLLAAAGITALLQPETATVRRKIAAVRESPKALLKAPRYLLLIGVVFFAGLAKGPINNMKVLVFESVGGNVSFLGWDAFIGCLIQSPFLLFVGRLKRIRNDYRLIGGGICAFLYAFLVWIASSPAMIVAGTIFVNISFGLLFPTMREMTEECVSVHLRTTAHGVADAAFGSIASMVATAWSGSMLESAGVNAMCAVCMLLAVVSLFFCGMIVLSRRVSLHQMRLPGNCASASGQRV